MERFDYYGKGIVVLHVATSMFGDERSLYGLTPECRGWSCAMIHKVAARLRRVRREERRRLHFVERGFWAT